ncbi:MAG: HAD-IC family P-type ATPase, partial [Gammaproteobacteria bacterium]|nr:HAD-IC family P-type ATPase [Gammaproteobacteria bacterium]
IVLDKTGTITMGKPAVSALLPLSGWDENRLLRIAASVEAGSEHPLAAALIEAARNRGLDLIDLSCFESLPGHGVSATIEDQQVLLGNERLMLGHGLPLERLNGQVADLKRTGQTLIYLAVEEAIAGIIVLSDPLKPDSAAAIDRLHSLGLKTVMLTGDNAVTAQAVAKAVGIDVVLAEVLPIDKSAQVALLQREGAVVGMVGDGINDAPALAGSDVGFALGSGTDVAIESADITLMRGSLHGVADAIAISRATVRNIKQNLIGAFMYNSVGIPIAAGLLYPFSGMLLNPIIGGAAMALSSVTVVGNANRLRLLKFRETKYD